MVTTFRTCANPYCTAGALTDADFYKNKRTCKQCYKDKVKNNNDKNWTDRRDILDKHLGIECVVCGEKKKCLLRCHEKNGQRHKKLLETPLEEVEANCKNGRFVRICSHCHGKTHALRDKGVTDWEENKRYLKEFFATDPPKENNAHLRAWQKFRDQKVKARQPSLPLDFS